MLFELSISGSQQAEAESLIMSLSGGTTVVVCRTRNMLDVSCRVAADMKGCCDYSAVS